MMLLKGSSSEKDGGWLSVQRPQTTPLLRLLLDAHLLSPLTVSLQAVHVICDIAVLSALLTRLYVVQVTTELYLDLG